MREINYGSNLHSACSRCCSSDARAAHRADLQVPRRGGRFARLGACADDTKQLDEIFGEDGAAIVSSGDPVADRNDFAKFLEAYDAKHELSPDDERRS